MVTLLSGGEDQVKAWLKLIDIYPSSLWTIAIITAIHPGFYHTY